MRWVTLLTLWLVFGTPQSLQTAPEGFWRVLPISVVYSSRHRTVEVVGRVTRISFPDDQNPRFRIMLEDEGRHYIQAEFQKSESFFQVFEVLIRLNDRLRVRGTIKDQFRLACAEIVVNEWERLP